MHRVRCPRALARSRARWWLGQLRRRPSVRRRCCSPPRGLAAFAESVGLELSRRGAAVGGGDRAVRAGGMRGALAGDAANAAHEPACACARSLERYPGPLPVALVRERAKPPYSRGGDRGVSAAGGRTEHAGAQGALRGAGVSGSRRGDRSPASCVMCTAAMWWRARAGCWCSVVGPPRPVGAGPGPLSRAAARSGRSRASG